MQQVENRSSMRRRRRAGSTGGAMLAATVLTLGLMASTAYTTASAASAPASTGGDAPCSFVHRTRSAISIPHELSVAGPNPSGCAGLRSFPIHVVFNARNVRKIVVTANDRRQKLLRMRPRPVVQINLQHRPKQTLVVRITIVTQRGNTIRGKHTYRPCHEVRLPGHSWFKL